jgi:hypothetical protein
MKLTKSQLRQIIREELDSVTEAWKPGYNYEDYDDYPDIRPYGPRRDDPSSDWTVEKWTELLNNILQQKDLTLTHEASPRNVAGVAGYLVKNNITPDHFKQSIMGHDYLDRNTLAAAGWPLQGGGDRDVATVVAGILMGPK